MAEIEIVRTVEHSTICISTTINHIFTSLFCSSNKHARTVKVLCYFCFRSFWTKVTKEYNKSVTACILNFFNSLEHVLFIFYSCLCLVETSFASKGLNNSSTSFFRERDNKTVSTYSNNSKFYVWNICHLFHDILLTYLK